MHDFHDINMYINFTFFIELQMAGNIYSHPGSFTKNCTRLLANGMGAKMSYNSDADPPGGAAAGELCSAVV